MGYQRVSYSFCKEIMDRISRGNPSKFSIISRFWRVEKYSNGAYQHLTSSTQCALHGKIAVFLPCYRNKFPFLNSLAVVFLSNPALFLIYIHVLSRICNLRCLLWRKVKQLHAVGWTLTLEEVALSHVLDHQHLRVIHHLRG